MAINPDKSVRKIVCLPRDVAWQISEMRHRRRIGFESELIRHLIEVGLAHELQAETGGTGMNTIQAPPV